MTEHFTFSALCHTDTGLPNDAPLALAGNLTKLSMLLEDVRALLGDKPIHVNSGYRSPAVNAKVKGAPTSQHMKGLAADFTPSDISILDAFHRIKESAVPYDQLILEPTWIHISVSAPGEQPRRQCLIARRGDGKMIYEVVA